MLKKRNEFSIRYLRAERWIKRHRGEQTPERLLELVEERLQQQNTQRRLKAQSTTKE